MVRAGPKPLAGFSGLYFYLVIGEKDKNKFSNFYLGKTSYLPGGRGPIIGLPVAHLYFTMYTITPPTIFQVID